jgi:hypothetical protein
VVIFQRELREWYECRETVGLFMKCHFIAFHLITLVNKPGRKESVLFQPGEEYPVAGPQV